jgi:hypothetical protein
MTRLNFRATAHEIAQRLEIACKALSIKFHEAGKRILPLVISAGLGREMADVAVPSVKIVFFKAANAVAAAKPRLKAGFRRIKTRLAGFVPT